MSSDAQFLAIDEEGYFVLADGVRLVDPQEGVKLLSHLQVDENGTTWTSWDKNKIIVEAFDKPLVGQQVLKSNQKLLLLAPYGFDCEIQINSFCLDAWDRFHGLTVNHIPFVLTRKAQAELFNLFDEFDDDSFVFAGQRYPTPPFYLENDSVAATPFWNEKYQQKETPRWDLGQHHPALEAILPQIKINKCRILNLGCGRGHDAAYFARQGHVVTGVDFSQTALDQAQAIYGSSENLKWMKENALKPSGFSPADLIFEHTLFCAIPPHRRAELIQQWKRSLDDRGHLLGLFFVHPLRGGPPYGCSEWELRELLEKHFRLLYWKRWSHSPERRQGTEIVIYAQKK